MSVTSKKTHSSPIQIANPPLSCPAPRERQWGETCKPCPPLWVTSTLRVGKGEEQRGGHADGFLSTAAHATVLHLTAEQLPDNRIPRGPKGAGKKKKKQEHSG